MERAFWSSVEAINLYSRRNIKSVTEDLSKVKETKWPKSGQQLTRRGKHSKRRRTSKQITNEQREDLTDLYPSLWNPFHSSMRPAHAQSHMRLFRFSAFLPGAEDHSGRDTEFPRSLVNHYAEV